MPHAVYPGETFSVDVIVSNGRKRVDSWALVVADKIRRLSSQDERNGGNGTTVTARAFLPHVKASSTGRTSYTGQLFKRGRYQVGPARISTRVPLGLIKGTIIVPKTKDHLLVYPKLGTISKRWKELVKVEQLGHRSSRRRQGQLEGDFFGLRDWRAGDSRRWIHWRSTAKRNEIVVRQFEQTQNQNFVILLDLFGRNEPRLELAISFAATIVVDHCRRNSGELVVGIGGEEMRFVKGSASNTFAHEALEGLAEARASSVDHLPSLLEQGLETVSSDDRLVIVSPNPVDIRDTERFSTVWNDRQKRRQVTRATCVSAGSAEFSKWFSYDSPPAPDRHERDSQVKLHEVQ